MRVIHVSVRVGFSSRRFEPIHVIGYGAGVWHDSQEDLLEPRRHRLRTSLMAKEGQQLQLKDRQGPQVKVAPLLLC
nr:hypothetical protein BaRGS_005364 [Batillaria attramentaria]